jgi:hypothetical protein
MSVQAASHQQQPASSSSAQLTQAMVLQLGNEYGLVVAAVGVIGVSGMAISTGVMSVRSKVFKNPEFLAKRAVQVMRDEHKKTFGTGPRRTRRGDRARPIRRAGAHAHASAPRAVQR